MYAYLDRPVATLSNGDRVLLGAMRRWALAATLGRDPVAAVGARDTVLVATETAACVDALMNAIDCGSTNPIALQRPCHDRVEECEAVLLAIGALVRDGRPVAAERALATMFDPAAAARIAALLADAQARIAAAIGTRG